MPTTDLNKAADIDAAVRQATGWTDMLERIEAIDPKQAADMRGKVLIASRTPWVAALGAVIGMVLGAFGLHLSPDASAGLGLLGVVIAGYFIRARTSAPISGIMKPKG